MLSTIGRDINLVVESSTGKHHRYFAGPFRLITPGASESVPQVKARWEPHKLVRELPPDLDTTHVAVAMKKS